MKRVTTPSSIIYFILFILLIGLSCIILSVKPSTEYVVFNHNNEILGLDMLDHEGTFDYEYEPTM